MSASQYSVKNFVSYSCLNCVKPCNASSFLSSDLTEDWLIVPFTDVHSIILKLHSNYFRRFLDSPEKAAAPTNAAFKYDYISVVSSVNTVRIVRPKWQNGIRFLHFVIFIEVNLRQVDDDGKWGLEVASEVRVYSQPSSLISMTLPYLKFL